LVAYWKSFGKGTPQGHHRSKKSEDIVNTAEHMADFVQFGRQIQKLVAIGTSLANLGNISKILNHDLKYK